MGTIVEEGSGGVDPHRSRRELTAGTEGPEEKEVPDPGSRRPSGIVVDESEGVHGTEDPPAVGVIVPSPCTGRIDRQGRQGEEKDEKERGNH